MAWIQGNSGGRSKATNFGVACTLLSQYMRGDDGVADSALDCGKGRLDAFPHPMPATMSLFPGIEEEAGEEEKKSNGSPMNLFPQHSGFGSLRNPNLREPEKAQLTIFYGGKVLTFDDFPAEKAKDLMDFASKGIGDSHNHRSVASFAAAGSIECRNKAASRDFEAATTVTVEGQSAVSAQQKLSDLPIARKTSLQRFLERRKDRINARAPYQAIGSSAKTSPLTPESKSWLALSPQVSECGHSGNSDGSK